MIPEVMEIFGWRGKLFGEGRNRRSRKMEPTTLTLVNLKTKYNCFTLTRQTLGLNTAEMVNFNYLLKL